MNTYWRSRLNWSNSKQSSWDSCKRAFYFDAIAKYEYPNGSQRSEEMWWLSKLTPQNAIVGTLIHDTLEQQVNQHHLGRAVSEESATQFFLMQLQEIQRDANTRVIEAVNGATIGPEVFASAREEGLRQLGNFFAIFWPTYQGLEYVQHERFESFQVHGIPVVVKLDLLTKSRDGQIIVTDWKTGQEDRAIDTNLQLGAYILWAQQKFDVPPDRIKAELAYLRTGRTRVTSRTAEELAKLREFIRVNGEAMLAVATESDLPASPEPWKCPGCHYATACADGQPFLGPHRNPFR